MAELTLRTMRRAELDVVLDWAAAEGWNPGLDDAGPFYATDPDGFFLAELGGEAAAAISVVNHEDGFAFLGLFICRQDLRGQGIGRALWDHALLHAGGRAIGLDGVPAQQDFYARAAFEPVGETCRWEGPLSGRADPAVRPLRAGDLPALIAMDSAASGFTKHAFLSAWSVDTESRASRVLERDGRRLGFLTWRRCRQGVKIGPLLAETDADAWTLLGAAAAELGEPTLVVDIPATQDALSERARSAGMTCSFRTARMIRGTPPRTEPLVATPATLELG